MTNPSAASLNESDSISIPVHDGGDLHLSSQNDVQFAPVEGKVHSDSQNMLDQDITKGKSNDVGESNWIARQWVLFKNNWVGDLLFLFQIVCCLTFGLGQFVSLLSSGSEGVSITWYGFWIFFLVINLALSFKSHEIAPSRGTIQTIWIYSLWSGVLLLDIFAIVFRGSIRWTSRDTFTAAASLVFLLISFSYGIKGRKLTLAACFRDPVIKGLAAVGFKAIPQCVLAYNVFVEGADGFNTFSVVSGHFTLVARIVQVYITIHQTSWELNRTATFASEIANELSWIVATIAIFIVKNR